MARVTKKDIYAEYGIQYADGKIYAPMFGWINPLLINGNSKLGKNIYTWSTLPTNETHVINFGTEEEPDYKEITGTCPCKCPGCYATTGCYNYSNVKLANAI